MDIIVSLKVSIIIVSFNVRDPLEDCLKGLEKESERLPVEVIVVDNASSDGTAEMLDDYYGKGRVSRVIINSENVGFATGCNQGAQLAEGEYILFLNPDTVVRGAILSGLVEYLEEQQNIGVIGPRILYPDGSLQLSCGSRLSIKYTIFDAYRLWKISQKVFGGSRYMDWDHGESRDVGWISGGCLMIRKDLFSKLDGFDEGYFIYAEDMDLCLRVRKEGYRVVYWPKVNIIHREARSSIQLRKRSLLLRYQSRLYYFRKHHGYLHSFVLRGIFATSSLAESVIVGIIAVIRRDRKYSDIMRAHLQAALKVLFLSLPDPPGSKHANSSGD